MDKQIDAFEKLVNHAVSRFSVERTRKYLTRMADPPFPSSPRRIAPRSQRAAVVEKAETPPTAWQPGGMDSVSKLRESLMRLKRRSQKSQSDNVLIGQVETFLRDMQYMRNLKRYFDEKIYSTLYRFYYDPSDLLETEVAETTTGRDAFFLTQQLQDDDEATGGIAVAQTGRSRRSNGFRYGLDIDRLTDKEQLAYAVDQLYDINTRWGHIVNTEDAMDPALFDLDSEVELRGVATGDPTYVLLRVTPDLFVKCQKSLQLARLWWTQASRIYSLSQHDAPAPIANYNEKMTALLRHIEQKERDIRKQEHAVNIHQADLQFLETREKRVTEIYGDTESLEKHKNELGAKYKRKIEQRKDLMDRLENTIKNTQRHKELEEELKYLEPEVIDLYRELKMLEYSLDIKQSQFSLELEVKSSFLIYSETSRVNMEKARQLLERLRSEKRKLERQYLLMKTNQERMCEILGRAQIGQDNRPKTNHTYTIRKLTQEEEKDLRSSTDAAKAYVVAKSTQKLQQPQTPGNGNSSSQQQSAYAKQQLPGKQPLVQLLGQENPFASSKSVRPQIHNNGIGTSRAVPSH